MATTPYTHEFTPIRSLLKRCVQCPNVAPSCPSCKADEVCQQTIADCDSCQTAKCVKTTTSGSTTSGITDGRAPNVGAIVGGVVGGVAVIGVIVFLVWKYWLKGRRHEREEAWDDPDYPLEKPDNTIFLDARSSRQSTHTVHSLASTVLTRASNIIQIAYIPGVTNRGGSASPGLLVPPVPPIPIPTTPSTVGSHFVGEQHFFVPGDLRGSTYSDTSSVDTRRPASIASSLARNSVATTVYRDSAVLNPMPAQAVFASKAAVISVKSNLSQNNSPALSGSTIHMSSLNPSSLPRPVVLGGAGAVQQMKPVALTIVKKGTKTGRSSIDGSLVDSSSTSAAQPPIVGLGLRPLTALSAASHDTTESPGARARRSVTLTLHTGDSDDSEDELEAHERSRRSLLRANRASDVNSPFTDAAEAPKSPTKPATPRTAGPKTKSEQVRGRSPFDDGHAL